MLEYRFSLTRILPYGRIRVSENPYSRIFDAVSKISQIYLLTLNFATYDKCRLPLNSKFISCSNLDKKWCFLSILAIFQFLAEETFEE